MKERKKVRIKERKTKRKIERKKMKERENEREKGGEREQNRDSQIDTMPRFIIISFRSPFREDKSFASSFSKMADVCATRKKYSQKLT